MCHYVGFLRIGSQYTYVHNMLDLKLYLFMHNTVTPMPNVILATSDGTGGAIYTVLMSDTQAMSLYVVDGSGVNRARQIVGK